METQTVLNDKQLTQIASMVRVCYLEEQSRKMLATHQVTTEWNRTQGAVRLVFGCQWGNSLPVSRITEIANVLGGVTGFTEDGVQIALTQMVSQKLLRSRMIQGVRHYELAFKD